MAAADAAGMLNRVSRPVSLEHELADVAAALERADAGPALFEAPKDSPWPIFSGAVSSRRTAALALGCEPGRGGGPHGPRPGAGQRGGDRPGGLGGVARRRHDRRRRGPGRHTHTHALTGRRGCLHHGRGERDQGSDQRSGEPFVQPDADAGPQRSGLQRQRVARRGHVHAQPARPRRALRRGPGHRPRPGGDDRGRRAHAGRRAADRGCPARPARSRCAGAPPSTWTFRRTPRW